MEKSLEMQPSSGYQLPSLQGLSELINCRVTCCTTHHQATYKGRPARAKATVLLIGLQGQAEAKDNLRASLLDLRLSSPNGKQNRCSLFEGLEAMSYQRRGVSSGWKYSSSLPSSIIKKPYIIREASQCKLAVLVVLSL